VVSSISIDINRFISASAYFYCIYFIVTHTAGKVKKNKRLSPKKELPQKLGAVPFLID
jgi:hypothetical protein